MMSSVAVEERKNLLLPEKKEMKSPEDKNLLPEPMKMTWSLSPLPPRCQRRERSLVARRNRSSVACRKLRESTGEEEFDTVGVVEDEDAGEQEACVRRILSLAPTAGREKETTLLDDAPVKQPSEEKNNRCQSR